MVMNPFDPNNVPEHDLKLQHERLQQRQWRGHDAELLDEFDARTRLAQDAANNAVRDANAAGAAAVAQIDAALDQALAELRNAKQNSLDAMADAEANAARRPIRAGAELEAATTEQIRRIEQYASMRLESACTLPAPPLATVDLDPNYSEKDFASASLDSITWVASELRRCMVRHGFNSFRVDYSRARSKPPTALAMLMAEFFANCPDRLDRLFARVMKLVGKDTEPAQIKTEPQTQDQRDAEAYLRSLEKLPEL